MPLPTELVCSGGRGGYKDVAPLALKPAIELSEVAQPRVAPTALEVGEPLAGGVEQEHDYDPHEIDHPKIEAGIGRRLGGRGAVEPIGVAKADHVHCHGEDMDEREMNQVVEERHATENEDGIQ